MWSFNGRALGARSGIALLVSLAVAGCGGGGDSGGGIDVPVVAMIDCGELPAALEGAPEGTKFFVDLSSDLSCRDGDPEAAPDFNGAELMFEYYIDGDYTNGQVQVFAAQTPYFSFSSIDPDVPTIVNAFGGAYGATALPFGEDVTLTLIDGPDETRTIELVFQLDPPYFILRSVTEL